MERIDPILMPPRRILVLEDEELLSWCIAYELRRLGYEVHVANNIKSGQEALQLFLPSLIICDQVFPDGLSLKMLSKWNESHEKTETILITAYTPPSALEMSNASTHICLLKPFEMKTLLGIIDDYFSAPLLNA